MILTDVQNEGEGKKDEGVRCTLFFLVGVKYVVPAGENFLGVTEAGKEEVNRLRIRMTNVRVVSFSDVP